MKTAPLVNLIQTAEKSNPEKGDFYLKIHGDGSGFVASEPVEGEKTIIAYEWGESKDLDSLVENNK